MPGVFEVHLPEDGPPGLAGPWEVSPPAPVSFDAGAVPAAEQTPLWRANLPGDQAAAGQALSEAEAELLAAEVALEGMSARMEALTRAGTASGVSFDASALALPPGSPEASALDLLSQAQAIEQGRPVSFGLEGLGSQAWEEAQKQFEAFLNQLQREVLNLAWVETNSGGRLLARTVIGWTGDSNTLWAEDTAAEERDLHRRSLTTAVRSRLLRVRIFSTVTGGAAKLSVMFTTPAGVVLALPAAWKLVTEILRQLKNYQTVSQGG